MKNHHVVRADHRPTHKVLVDVPASDSTALFVAALDRQTVLTGDDLIVKKKTVLGYAMCGRQNPIWIEN